MRPWRVWLSGLACAATWIKGIPLTREIEQLLPAP
ncbi:UNVERIFIED_ORG: hypothetical protein J2W82_004741 [Pseudomonas mohnii]|nr:hypothetical protein [Pseudomonas mohnii]